MYNHPRVPDSNQILKMIESGVSLKLDPKPLTFNKKHKEQGKIFHQMLSYKNDGLFQLRNTILRNSFLYGCLLHTVNNPYEHLIAGYGNRRGGGVDIDQIYHIRGDENSISINYEDVILGQIASMWPSKQLIVFHNHPNNNMTKYLGRPFPSVEDRDTLLFEKYLSPLQIIRLTMGWKENMKFYLGEKGMVMEYRTPAISGIIKFFIK